MTFTSWSSPLCKLDLFLKFMGPGFNMVCSIRLRVIQNLEGKPDGLDDRCNTSVSLPKQVFWVGIWISSCILEIRNGHRGRWVQSRSLIPVGPVVVKKRRYRGNVVYLRINQGSKIHENFRLIQSSSLNNYVYVWFQLLVVSNLTTGPFVCLVIKTSTRNVSNITAWSYVTSPC